MEVDAIVRARHLRAFVLASVIGVNAAMVPVGVATANAPAPAAVQKESQAPVRVPEKVSDKIKAQTMEKMGARDQLANVQSIGGARPGEPLDKGQPSVADLVSGGKLTDGAENGFSYVQPYKEPNDYAHRNYCGPGAAVGLLSHWDAKYGETVDIDKLGEAMDLDPASGVWVKDIVKPVNDELSRKAGHEVKWYQYGDAQSQDDLRWMLDLDIRQNGVPLITSLQTGGLPGWGGTDVGHIVVVNGYWKDASGKEWVTYMDTAPPSSGYRGSTFVTVDLATFWQAVSGNSAQVW